MNIFVRRTWYRVKRGRRGGKDVLRLNRFSPCAPNPTGGPRPAQSRFGGKKGRTRSIMRALLSGQVLAPRNSVFGNTQEQAGKGEILSGVTSTRGHLSGVSTKRRPRWEKVRREEALKPTERSNHSDVMTEEETKKKQRPRTFLTHG